MPLGGDIHNPVDISNLVSGEWTDTGSILHPTETTDDVVIGGTTLAGSDIILKADGSVVFNEQGNDADFRVESQNITNMLEVDASEDVVRLAGGTSNSTGVAIGHNGVTNDRYLDYNGVATLTETGSSWFGSRMVHEIDPSEAITTVLMGTNNNFRIGGSSMSNITKAYGFNQKLFLDDTYSGTITDWASINLTEPENVGAGSPVITNYRGVKVDNFTGFAPANIYGFVGQVNSGAGGTSEYNLYMSGTADNYFNGILEITPDTKINVPGIDYITWTVTGGSFSVLNTNEFDAIFRSIGAGTNTGTVRYILPVPEALYGKDVRATAVTFNFTLGVSAQITTNKLYVYNAADATNTNIDNDTTAITSGTSHSSSSLPALLTSSEGTPVLVMEFTLTCTGSGQSVAINGIEVSFDND